VAGKDEVAADAALRGTGNSARATRLSKTGKIRKAARAALIPCSISSTSKFSALGG